MYLGSTSELPTECIMILETVASRHFFISDFAAWMFHKQKIWKMLFLQSCLSDFCFAPQRSTINLQVIKLTPKVSAHRLSTKDMSLTMYGIFEDESAGCMENSTMNTHIVYNSSCRGPNKYMFQNYPPITLSFLKNNNFLTFLRLDRIAGYSALPNKHCPWHLAFPSFRSELQEGLDLLQVQSLEYDEKRHNMQVKKYIYIYICICICICICIYYTYIHGPMPQPRSLITAS